MRGLYEPYYCSWVLIIVGSSVSGVNPQAAWLWELSFARAYELLCMWWPYEVELALAGSGSCWDLPLEVLLMELIGSCSYVIWNLSLGVLLLGPLRRDCIVGQCQTLLVTGLEMFGASKWPTVCCSLSWAYLCIGEAKVHTKDGFHHHQT